MTAAADTAVDVASVGLLRPPTNQRSAPHWAAYATEVLAHAGIAARELVPADLVGAERDTLPRLLLVGERMPLSGAEQAAVTELLTGGGAVLVVGDPGPLAELSGARAGDAVAEGWVDATAPWSTDTLHAWGGVGLHPDAETEVLGHWANGSAAITARRRGAGTVVVVGADVWQSIVRIQQGFAVEGDGTPAADGTAPIDDGICKCEDGLALSFDADRALAPGATPADGPFRHEYPPTVAAPIFHHAQADRWRELLLGGLTWLAERSEIPLPWLFYWPAGVEAVAHMSHDSDGNLDAAADAALRAFADGEVPVTWCVMHPGGYSTATYGRIAAAGHEIALHYNAMGDTELDRWGRDELIAQMSWLRQAAGVEAVVSNKNHYTRWEGWAEFYQWCEELGIELDESRGPSKQGTIGFPFGTSHPAFPLADADRDGRVVDVLMLPLHAQDLWWTSVLDNRAAILDEAQARHGVAHFLFHGANIIRHQEIAAAVVSTAQEARRRGLPWWTAAQINRWERQRRTVRVDAVSVGEARIRLRVRCADAVGPVALVLAGLDPDRGWRIAAGDGTLDTVRRNGRRSPQLVLRPDPGLTVVEVAAEPR